MRGCERDILIFKGQCHAAFEFGELLNIPKNYVYCGFCRYEKNRFVGMRSYLKKRATTQDIQSVQKARRCKEKYYQFPKASVKS